MTTPSDTPAVSDMLERAGDAVDAILRDDTCTVFTSTDIARAVLMAVREPSDDMIDEAGWSDYDVGCWTEGLDAILSQGPGR